MLVKGYKGHPLKIGQTIFILATIHTHTSTETVVRQDHSECDTLHDAFHIYQIHDVFHNFPTFAITPHLDHPFLFTLSALACECYIITHKEKH